MLMSFFTVAKNDLGGLRRVTFKLAPCGRWVEEVGDFEAFHCQPSTNFDRSTKLDLPAEAAAQAGLTTESPVLGRC